jgi:hypothetical protein
MAKSFIAKLSRGRFMQNYEVASQARRGPPNKALQLTANPLRGLPAAELGRYAAIQNLATDE